MSETEGMAYEVLSEAEAEHLAPAALAVLRDPDVVRPTGQGGE